MRINSESINSFDGETKGHSNSVITIGMFLYIFPLEVCDLVAKDINVFLQHCSICLQNHLLSGVYKFGSCTTEILDIYCASMFILSEK
jgi:hypothetical protein